jgi:hypothetical protein
MAQFRAILIILLGLITPLLAVGQMAQAPAAKTATTDTPTSGAITGKVVDERSQPLPNALVSVRAVGSAGPDFSVNTDREGAFHVDGLDRASYIVSVSLPAYTSPPRDPSITPAATYRIGDSVTFTLIKGGVITGTVTNSTGEPVVNVGVRVQMVRDTNGRRLPNGTSVERLTDDRGIYRIYGLPTGTYVVLVGGPSTYSRSAVDAFELDVPTYAPSSTRDTAMEIGVRAGEETTGIDIRYRGEPGRTISGKVSFANAAPDVNYGYNVTLTSAGDKDAPWLGSAYQQPGGGFVLNGIADGDYILTAQMFSQSAERGITAPKRIRVRGADVTGIELIARPLASVSGRVVLEETKAVECTDKRRPLFNETLVSAWHNDNDAAKEVPQFIWSFGTPVPPDDNGNFALRNLAPGDYFFVARFSAKYWYLHSMTFPSSVPAGARVVSKPVDAARVWTNIKAGDRLAGLTITLAEGAASLRGQLALGEGAQVPERLFVYLVPVERESADNVLRFYAAPVAADGKLTLNNLAPGRYWILTQTFNDDTLTPQTKLRLPHETETRSKLRRDGEAAKTEIEFKPCQNVLNYQLKPREQ